MKLILMLMNLYMFLQVFLLVSAYQRASPNKKLAPKEFAKMKFGRKMYTFIIDLL